VVVDDSGTLPSYSNFCRVTATPEEVILDFGLNPQPFATGRQDVKANQRIVMNFYTAKRLLTALGMTIQRHEGTFGAIELGRPPPRRHGRPAVPAGPAGPAGQQARGPQGVIGRAQRRRRRRVTTPGGLNRPVPADGRTGSDRIDEVILPRTARGPSAAATIGPPPPPLRRNSPEARPLPRRGRASARAPAGSRAVLLPFADLRDRP
jgi:hypothetical protein